MIGTLRLRVTIAVALLVAILLAVAIWRNAHQSPFLGTDGRDTRQQVLHGVPLGSTLTQAQATMEANGFRCELQKAARFPADNPDGRSQTLYGPADVLTCDSGKKIVWKAGAAKRWQVTFAYTSNIVTGVYAATSPAAP